MPLFSAALTLFFVMDPFGNVPTVMGLLRNVPIARRPWVVARESLFALFLLAGFYLAGPWMTRMLGLSGPDLQMGGGVVLFLIALRMIFPNGKPITGDAPESEPFLVPLATPLIAGPSALTTVMLMAGQSADKPWDGLGMLALAWGASAIILCVGVTFGSRFPPRLIQALERLAGLLLIVMGIHMVMSGAMAYFHPPAP
jgi:multiple antibiotic resistance protein